MEFKGDLGEFLFSFNKKINYLYFPLCNYKGLKSSITPTLNGDIKIDNQHFGMEPVSQESLNNDLLARKIWLKFDENIWCSTGNTCFQRNESEKLTIHGKILMHEMIRENAFFSVKIETFVPQNELWMEMSQITIKNLKREKLTVKPFVAIPIYGRSADNIRDHRHVSSLLNRIHIAENRISNQPTMIFDEKGHRINQMKYSVLIDREKTVKNYYPTTISFQGEGENLNYPEAVSKSISSLYPINAQVDGLEALGGFELEEITLNPEEEYQFVYSFCITEGEEDLDKCSELTTVSNFDRLSQENLRFWDKELSTLQIQVKNQSYNQFLKWVTLQPILRRIYGCSFMPHHDYGKGGRGWRDLWQDCLALIIMNPQSVETLLYNNFAGVRIDGSNATIIGLKNQEFIADRNNIPRMWMDHGAWPFLTTKLYLDKTGNYDFLFKKQIYFKDANISFSKEKDSLWSPEEGCIQRDKQNNLYEGTILEHILLQNVLPFFNSGFHNNYRLEGADWNDGMDMACENGESVSFTFLYTQNLKDIHFLFQKLIERGITQIEILEEFKDLFFAVYDFNHPKSKNTVRDHYFTRISHYISGIKVKESLLEVCSILEKMISQLTEHLNEKEFISNQEEGFYRGYYDNNSESLESIKKGEVFMSLTPQVFALMSGIGSRKQNDQLVKTTQKYLFDPRISGYRLNTDFKIDVMNNKMGRLFAFAYGHKENGAMFSHMSVMYANALYKQGYVREGNHLLKSLIDYLLDERKSKIYPGIPEYINEQGVGMYHYLTGSASWLILTYVNEVFGIKGDLGNLIIEPKLSKDDFITGKASIETIVNGLKIQIQFYNPKDLEYDQYWISSVRINREEQRIQKNNFIRIPKEKLKENDFIEIVLEVKNEEL